MIPFITTPTPFYYTNNSLIDEIRMKIGVLESNRIVSTLLLILALISFKEIYSLPVIKPSHSKDTETHNRDETESRKSTVRPRRDIGLVGVNETAAGIIYHVNEPLIREFPGWLVEMDIVKSPIVEEFLRHGIDERPTTDSEGMPAVASSIDQREKKASFNAQQHNYLYWPNARIPYAFHPYINDDAREAVRRAMDHWMAHTCIKFVEREPDEHDYVEIVEMNGCWSYVGKQGGDQKLSIGVSWQPYCKYKGVLIHELGHSIGFWHEQTRPDRDTYVRIVWENMISSAYLNFLRYSSNEVDSLSIPYDYASIMHYPSNAFTKNGRDTIVPLEPGVKVMGQRNSLSPLDIKQANLLYKCKVMNNETSITDGHLNVIDTIPPDAFQIQNIKTNACLTALKIDNSGAPNLYNVSTTECNSSLSQQFWKWTENDTILNVGSYLCLTTLNGSGTGSEGGSETETLSLQPCMGMDNGQKWSCAGDYIQQPTSGKCLTTSDASDEGWDEDEADSNQILDENSLETSNTSNNEEEETFMSHMNDISKRDTDLRLMVEELGQFLYDTEETDDSSYSNDHNDSSQSSANGTASLHEPLVTAKYCLEGDQLQIWRGIPKNQDSSRLIYGNSICSPNGTSEHNLPRCYANDMENAISMLSNNDLDISEWITCEKHGYYVTGFYHTHLTLGNRLHVREGLITGMHCCATSSVFTGEVNSPVTDYQDECDEVEWWSFQDVLISEGWFSCPKGKFLKGFKVGLSLDHDGVHRIFKASCCRPHSAMDVYEHCYTDRSRQLDNTGVHSCRMEGYLVTAMYLDGCVEGEGCTENLTCCIEA